MSPHVFAPVLTAAPPVAPSYPHRVAAAMLHAASLALARAAQRLVAVAPRAAAPAEPVLEFYAEAGAPEGALYVDGVRVATLPGVTRL